MPRRKKISDFVDWPVIAIRGRRLKNFRLQWRCEFSRFDNDGLFVGDIYEEKSFYTWAFEEQMTQQTIDLIQFYNEDGNFTCLEFDSSMDPSYYTDSFDE